MSKLYRVELTYVAYVLIDDDGDHEDAIVLAQNEIDSMSIKDEAFWDAEEAESIEEEWYNALPYGGDGTQTCGEWLTYWRAYHEAWDTAQVPDPNQLALELA